MLPSDWPNKYVTCGGSHQSPVDVDITTNQFCSNDLSTVTSWGTEHSEEVQWVVHNTGRNRKFNFNNSSSGDLTVSTRLSNQPRTTKLVYYVTESVCSFSVEIRLQPERSLYSAFHGSDVKHYVDKIHIKFGDSGYRGSEHSIGGKVYAGEVRT